MLKLHITATNVIVVFSTATFVNNANCVEIYNMLYDWLIFMNKYILHCIVKGLERVKYIVIVWT